MIQNDSVFRRLLDSVRGFYNKLDFAHDLQHGIRVSKIAEMISNAEGGNVTVCQLGGLIHQYHDEPDQLRTTLMSLAFDGVLMAQLMEIARQCRPGRIGPSDSLEARIVFDADALELITARGAVRELLCNFQVRQLGWEEAVSRTIETQKLFQAAMQTTKGKMMADHSVFVCGHFWKDYQHWKELRQ
jgi:HD superfamily phosphodiesterase